MVSRSEIYRRYNDTLRPLVSQIEGRNESFEEPLLIDVACLFDTLSSADVANDEVEKEALMQRASMYLDLSISHGYQFLVRNLHEKMLSFEKRCGASDRNILEEGLFIGKYKELKRTAIESVRIGRMKDDVDALSDFSRAYTAYCKIEKLIDKELPVQIMQNTRRDSVKWTVVGWVISFAISIMCGWLASVYGSVIIDCL